MERVNLYRVSTGEFLAGPLDVAGTLWERTVGLLGRSGLEPGHGMIIENCWAVHTFFMRFPIDVIFTDAGMRVTRVRPSVAPWRMSASIRADRVIELGVGSLSSMVIGVGDELETRSLSAQGEGSTT